MTAIVVDDADKEILSRCPFLMITEKSARYPKAYFDRMKRIKRLWSGGLLRGEVLDNGRALRLVITDAGRMAIGQKPIETTRSEDAA